jgi:DNA-binding response OmpR family regulator
VSCAYTGEEARVAVLDRHIDLVIQEVVLPDALGIDLAVELAKRGTSILLMTDSARLIGMLSHFSFPVVRKPFRLSDLLEAVRAVLATRPAPAT